MRYKAILITQSFILIRSFVFEFSDNFSVTNLFGNLCDRIDFLLSETFDKDQWKLSGKMYRSKQPSENKSICTLQDSHELTSLYLINGKEIIEADHFLDSIIGKLNLMYSARQSYSIEGAIWKSKQKHEDVLVKCATIHGGSEAVNILIQVKSDEILKTVFPDLLNESTVKLVEVPVDEKGKGYFDIIIKAIKLTI